MQFFYLLRAHGEDRVTVALYRYRPNSVRSLAILIGNDVEQDTKYAYFGSALWRIVQFLARGESSFPTWFDMFDHKKHAEKEQTADDIKKKVIRDLRR